MTLCNGTSVSRGCLQPFVQFFICFNAPAQTDEALAAALLLFNGTKHINPEHNEPAEQSHSNQAGAAAPDLSGSTRLLLLLFCIYSLVLLQQLRPDTYVNYDNLFLNDEDG